MTLTTTEDIYEQIVKPLPAAERLRLVNPGDRGQPTGTSRLDVAAWRRAGSIGWGGCANVGFTHAARVGRRSRATMEA